MSCFWGPTLLVGGEVTIAEGPSIADIEAALAARRPNWIALAKVHLLRLIERGVTQRLSFPHVKAFAVPDSAKQLSAMLGATLRADVRHDRRTARLLPAGRPRRSDRVHRRPVDLAA